MAILSSLKDIDALVKDNVKEMILDLPVASENKLRGQMLVAIFSNYGKYLLNKGIAFKEVNDTVSSLISEFKQKNRTFCNAEYTTKSLNNIKEYHNFKQQLKKNIAQDFLTGSATYLKKYVQDADVVTDLEQAEESLQITKPAGIHSLSLADYYLDQCKEKIKMCNIDVDFINAL